MIDLVGALGVAELPAREEEFGAPELHLVVMHRVLVGLYEELHRLHGLFGTPELVVRTGLLVDHPVVVLVVRVFGEQAVVERDGLERPGGRRLARRRRAASTRRHRPRLTGLR